MVSKRDLKRYSCYSFLIVGTINSNLYSKCCPCSKNGSKIGGGDGEGKDKYKKQQEKNKNTINNLEGVVGLTCKLENNKICLYTKVPGNDNYKFAESVEEFKGEFKYENFKGLKINIKIDEFGIDWLGVTLEEQIEYFKEDLSLLESFEFLRNKIIFNKNSIYIYDLSDMKGYINRTDGNQICFLQNADFSDLKEPKCKVYGITNKGKYYKEIEELTGYYPDAAEEKQKEYKEAFFEGK